jgi:DNA-binding transcriptional MerR regulator
MDKTPPPVKTPLPEIPAKRYFTIGEVSELCGVKPYVLRYWEQEFSQLKPMKRRGNRRYYQHHEVLLIRRIRDLLYEQGFTINGARNRLADESPRGAALRAAAQSLAAGQPALEPADVATAAAAEELPEFPLSAVEGGYADLLDELRAELFQIRALLDHK